MLSDGNKVGTVSKAEVEAGADAVTRADLMAQKLIEGSLREHFPGLRIVGEEDVDEFIVKPYDLFTVAIRGQTC